jgi:hypothetical protein
MSIFYNHATPSGFSRGLSASIYYDGGYREGRIIVAE